jgi:hypothetical protein
VDGSKRITRALSSTALQRSFAVDMDESMRTRVQAVSLSPCTPYAAGARLDRFASRTAFPDMLQSPSPFGVFEPLRIWVSRVRTEFPNNSDSLWLCSSIQPIRRTVSSMRQLIQTDHLRR